MTDKQLQGLKKGDKLYKVTNYLRDQREWSNTKHVLEEYEVTKVTRDVVGEVTSARLRDVGTNYVGQSTGKYHLKWFYGTTPRSAAQAAVKFAEESICGANREVKRQERHIKQIGNLAKKLKIRA